MPVARRSVRRVETRRQSAYAIHARHGASGRRRNAPGDRRTRRCRTHRQQGRGGISAFAPALLGTDGRERDRAHHGKRAGCAVAGSGRNARGETGSGPASDRLERNGRPLRAVAQGMGQDSAADARATSDAGAAARRRRRVRLAGAGRVLRLESRVPTGPGRESDGPATHGRARSLARWKTRRRSPGELQETAHAAAGNAGRAAFQACSRSVSRSSQGGGTYDPWRGSQDRQAYPRTIERPARSPAAQ